MSSTAQNRTKFNNEWPATFLFPAEQSLRQSLAKHNFISIFFPAQFKHSSDHSFQALLSHCIDALDNLPFRPDLAFDQIWKTLDAELIRLKSHLHAPADNSRFSVFSAHIFSVSETSKSHHALAPHIPQQTCEYLAKRVLDSVARPDGHAKTFRKRFMDSIGSSLLSALHGKYDAGWHTHGLEARRKEISVDCLNG